MLSSYFKKNNNVAQSFFFFTKENLVHYIYNNSRDTRYNLNKNTKTSTGVIFAKQ